MRRPRNAWRDQPIRTFAAGRQEHLRANPLYLDDNHLLHLRAQILERLACQLPVVRLAIGGRSAGPRPPDLPVGLGSPVRKESTGKESGQADYDFMADPEADGL